MYKIYWSEEEISTLFTLEQWDDSPVSGLQLLSIKLSLEEKGKTRVAWYLDGTHRRIFGDTAYYGWVKGDSHPTQFTPDAVLDLWHQKTGETSTKLCDLSLDDFASLSVKLGRSIPDEKFERILQRAIADAEIP